MDRVDNYNVETRLSCGEKAPVALLQDTSIMALFARAYCFYLCVFLRVILIIAT